ncbi:MAG: hypothetical protein EU532_06465 [Promethearchaeota archaeon]|nr:MAG: hypothetical protein EU532_06465 [Candidatus Lokiarchaeota archaeon]
MIKQLYIIKFNGTLLFSKSFVKERKIEDNVLIGFFASLANFSREALESEIEYIDLSHDDKLVLFPQSTEKLLATAIVSSIDDNELISKILRNILQDFIGAFAPDFDPDKINLEEMDRIINQNLEGKISRPLIHRLVYSWILLIPLCILLNIANITSGQYIFQNLYLDKELYSQQEIYTEVIPAMIRISLIVLLIVFILPNIISGYLVLNEKYAYLNSTIYLILIMVIYFYTIETLFAYVILAYLPLVFLMSIGFSYFGFRLAKKRKIIRN